MTLLQWNILFKENPKNIIGLINKYSPDIICLQEISVRPDEYQHIDNVARYIADNIGYNYYFKIAQSWENDKDMEAIGNCILTKHKITKTNFKYIQKPIKNSKEFDQEGRIYIECSIEIDGKSIKVGTTHMSYTHEFEITDKKQQEVNELMKILSNKKNKFIFSGDLNSKPDSYTIRKLSRILKHCGPDYDQNTWTTKPFEYMGFTANTLDWRLYYVFATNDLKIIDSRIINTQYSDHLPIITEFEL